MERLWLVIFYPYTRPSANAGYHNTFSRDGFCSGPQEKRRSNLLYRLDRRSLLLRKVRVSSVFAILCIQFLDQLFTLNVQVRQDAVQPLWQPPSLVTEESHYGGNQRHANHKGIN